MKRKHILLSLLMFAPLSVSLASCDKKQEEIKEEKIEINFETSTLECFEDDVFKLAFSTNSKKNPVFSSSDISIASISSEGVIAAKKPGEVEIHAIVEGVEAVCTITIKDLKDKKEAYISCENNSFVVGLNETEKQQIKPTFMNKDGQSEQKQFTFTSSDESILTVDNTGILTPKGVGSGYVTVKADNVESKVYFDSYTMTIKTPEEWLDMLKIVNKKGARYSLLNDLDFTGYTYEVGSGYVGSEQLSFIADIKGNNHTISNITFENPTSSVSLFGLVTAFEISNVTFKNIRVISDNSVTFGICTHVMRHINEGGENVLYPTLFSNVLFDITLSPSVVFTGFANYVYGIGAESVYFNVKTTTGDALNKKKMLLLGQGHYLWWDGSTLRNTIFRLDGTKEYSNPTEGFNQYSPLLLVNFLVTDHFIEASHFGSQYFDKNVWNFIPNDIPTLNE